MKRLGVLVLPVAMLLALPTLAATDPRLAQAEGLAKKREIDAAADLYRGLLADGVDGPGIRYNLGALCIEQGRAGEAVLQLLAAQRLDPLDDDIKHNLTVALDARTDRLAGDPAPNPIATVGNALSPRLARVVLAVPLALCGALLAALALLTTLGDKARRALRIALTTCAALGVVGAGLWACRLSVEHTTLAVVLVDSTPALKDPDDAAAVSFTAHAGLFGAVQEDGGAFVRVRFENGLEAWLKTSAVGTVR